MDFYDKIIRPFKANVYYKPKTTARHKSKR